MVDNGNDGPVSVLFGALAPIILNKIVSCRRASLSSAPPVYLHRAKRLTNQVNLVFCQDRCGVRSWSVLVSSAGADVGMVQSQVNSSGLRREVIMEVKSFPA